jgi:hypothetical protein
MPAPKGKGLVVEKECSKILKLTGIRDIWSKTKGQTKNKINLIYALEDALRKLSSTKIKQDQIEPLSIVDGAIPQDENAKAEIAEEKTKTEKNGTKTKKHTRRKPRKK